MLLAGSELIEESDLILPIPLYRWRIWARRFNQSSLIANRLAARCNKPSDNNLLIRHKKTRQQVGLNENQRKKNLSGAFSIAEKTANQVEHKIILLIDDVITTGSTANAAAAVLKRAGAAKVNLLTLASVPKD
jgi:ComF family protein